MGTHTGPRRIHALAAAALTTALVAVPLTTSTVAGASALSPEIDEDGVELLDDAFDALSNGDTTTYDRLANAGWNGEVWLPFPAIMALQDREADEIYAWSFILDAENSELLDDYAYQIIEEEQTSMALYGPSMTGAEFDDLLWADTAGGGLLEVIDRRQIEIPQSARQVLAVVTDFENLIPESADYTQAIADLDALLDEGSGDAAEPTPEPVSVPPAEADAVAAPLLDTPAEAESAADAEPAVEPIVEPVAEAVAEPVTGPVEAAEPAAEPTATETGSSMSSQLPMILTLAVAGFALFVALFAARKGGKSDELADIAFTDSLTGLNNRRRLDADVAAQVAAGERSTAVLMVDVDHFKKFNDEHGHAMGDEVLRLVGESLSATFRKKDVPYRYGGEEFCVILADTTRGEAIDAGERARKAIEQIELPIPGGITASVGVSTGPAIALTGTIERADSALYDAKKAGRNCVADGDANNPPEA